MKWTAPFSPASRSFLPRRPPAATPRRRRARPRSPISSPTPGSATQLVTVASLRASSQTGAVRVWEKRGDCWTQAAGPWQAWLGIRGISERKREGDLKTPSGAFGIQSRMFGVGPNPGVRYRYRRIVCGDWWVEDPGSRFYNRFSHVPLRSETAVPDHERGHVEDRRPAYRTWPVIDYNTHPIVPGRGSGIFLHVSHGNPTLGCVSIALPQLLRLCAGSTRRSVR
jgi:L,D-peptidoglycan transpeptidase YkuD (ErfK/YbiS/YcfS/YnhG family)